MQILYQIFMHNNWGSVLENSPKIHEVYRNGKSRSFYSSFLFNKRNSADSFSLNETEKVLYFSASQNK